MKAKMAQEFLRALLIVAHGHTTAPMTSRIEATE